MLVVFVAVGSFIVYVSQTTLTPPYWCYTTPLTPTPYWYYTTPLTPARVGATLHIKYLLACFGPTAILSPQPTSPTTTVYLLLTYEMLRELIHPLPLLT